MTDDTDQKRSVTETTEQKRDAAETFDEHADAYVESRVHRAGDDLETLASWCDEADRALDIATGAGHTAGAIADRGVDEVCATDAAPEMVATARSEFPGLRGVVTDAERLPFRESAFDAVACRIAAHHFPDPEAFVSEVGRVTDSGGVFAFEDNIAPEDDALDEFLNQVERLRDPTHVRSHRDSEWRAWIRNAGFEITDSVVITKTIDYPDWVRQLDTPAKNREQLEALFADPPDDAANLFEIELGDDGKPLSFANLKVLIRAKKQ
ncbi:class I SAM-dependent methyltransferase [Halovenus marina]|uniref:class I SAM-dependent methyltransferase n=1 Tax=Halovenus marina TaxID=3396621 RepID=UPI003F561F3B